MPLSDLFKLHDPALEDDFNKKPYKADKDRAAFIKALEAIKGQIKAKNTKVPNRMWSIANEVVKLTPNFKGRPITIMGEKTFFIPENHLDQAIATIKEGVEAGDLDGELEGVDGQGAATAATAKPKGTREPSDQKSGIRKSIGTRLKKGQKLADIETVLRANSKYAPEDVTEVLAEYQQEA